MSAKPPPEVAHIARTPEWAAPIAILIDADFVLHLPDHDARLAGVGRHPVKHAGGGAHGIGAIEFDAGGSASHA